MKTYYQEHKQHLIEYRELWHKRNPGKKKQYSRSRTLNRQTALHWYKQEQGCYDCDIIDWRVLEFDHVPERCVGTVNRALGEGNMSRADMWVELQKCDVVCANCHSLRTHARRLDNRPEICYTSK